MLSDVRRALGRNSAAPPPPLPPFIEPVVKMDAGELMGRFVAELSDLGAHVHHQTDNGKQLAETIEEICRSLDITEVVMSGSSSLSESGLTSQLPAAGFSVFVAGGGSAHDQVVSRLAGSGAGITEVEYAIAETGTIVLSSEATNSLLVSLLPPVHIALVRTSQISASLDEVINKLAVERLGRADPTRSVSFITGPSRTSDVELTLSIGVHGPKELHVIIIDA